MNVRAAFLPVYAMKFDKLVLAVLFFALTGSRTVKRTHTHECVLVLFIISGQFAVKNAVIVKQKTKESKWRRTFIQKFIRFKYSEINEINHKIYSDRLKNYESVKHSYEFLENWLYKNYL